jgi:methylmalonyl-CoA mutase N-terminal domain/subunit
LLPQASSTATATLTMSGEDADSPPVPNKVFGVGVDIPYSSNNRRLTEQSRLTKKYFLLTAGLFLWSYEHFLFLTFLGSNVIVL